MALTPSAMIPLGTVIPEFKLLDVVSEKQYSSENSKNNCATVIMFICNHCPFVKHILDKLIEIANDYQKKNIRFIAICSNDAKNYLQDAPDKMKMRASEKNFPFPYLYDETQAVAKSFHAECTPDFFVFDQDAKCVYRGQFDDARPGNNIPVSGKDLQNALDAILAGKIVNPNQKPSIGCNIKWKQ